MLLSHSPLPILPPCTMMILMPPSRLIVSCGTSPAAVVAGWACAAARRARQRRCQPASCPPSQGRSGAHSAGSDPRSLVHVYPLDGAAKHGRRDLKKETLPPAAAHGVVCGNGGNETCISESSPQPTRESQTVVRQCMPARSHAQCLCCSVKLFSRLALACFISKSHTFSLSLSQPGQASSKQICFAP